MAFAPPSALAASDDATEIRRRAMRRLAIAVLMLTAAFGALLTYERFKSPRMVAPEARPSPAAALKPPAEPLPEAAPAVEATPSEPAAPTAAEAPAAPPPPPPPQVINNERPPATGGPPPRLTPTRPDTAAPKAPAAAAPPAPGAVTRPAPATTAPPPASSTAPAPKPDVTRGYAVQLGVFASPPNAEALQRKLAEAGLTTFTETRVLIGPFRDRAEADRSMEIVKKLGLAGVVVPARP
jgi:DedD protein